MNIPKALLTVAGPNQRTLPLQTLVDRDGQPKPALRVILQEILSTGVEKVGLVIRPGDESVYRAAAGEEASRLQFLVQEQPRGFGHAVACAKDFVGDDAFLLVVGDHLYLSRGEIRCARQLVDLAREEACSISAVQATHESKLPYFGAVGGRRISGRSGLYEVETVLEKPTPTQAEQSLIVPGLRAGHYLCFFGMHVMTPSVQEFLAKRLETLPADASLSLTPALLDLARQEQYLAAELNGQRFDIGGKYGLFTAQLAFGLEGQDREEVLANMLELIARRQH